MSKASKQLAYVLRHDPGSVGLDLEIGGWVRIDVLLKALKAHGHALPRADFDALVADDEKKRYTISQDGQKVRAAQGHSIPVDLGLTPIVPPPVLYHGTATRFLDAIFKQGLLPMGRDKVHLSGDIETAIVVGKRHGKPIVLALDVPGLQEAGQEFWRADNGVYLTDAVGVSFLRIEEDHCPISSGDPTLST